MLAFVRSCSLLALATLALARESSSPFSQALSLFPSLPFLNGPQQLQSPLGVPDGFHYADLSLFPSNATHEALSQWTFPPHCLTDPDLAEPLCVFALHSFAHGRGISLITTPTDATAFLQMPSFKSGDAPPGANVQRSSIMEEKEIPGAGRGMMATTRLQRGDNLYTFTPILLIHPDVSELSEANRISIYHQAVRSMPAPAQKLFWDLAAHQPDDEDGAVDRIDTNTFGFELFDSNYAIVNPEIARLNHDCRPNAVYFFDTTSMTQYINVVRPVAPGEQLSISYIDASMPRAKRVKKLHFNWGFTCACSLCTQHPELTRASDVRLAEIERLTTELENSADAAPGEPTLSASAGIAAAESLVALYELERYDAALGEPLTYAALAHAAAGDATRAKAYGSRALQAVMLEDGFYHEDVAYVRTLAENPTRHRRWNTLATSATKGCGCGCSR